MLRSLLLVVLAALVPLAGCAKPGPPPGGPVDEDPPWVVSTEPVDGSTSVPVETGIFVLFSEEMDRSSAERAVEFIPEITLKRARWSGPRLEVRPADGLADSTTYVVKVGDSARDYHSVAMDDPVTFAFSTGVALDDCGVTGTVSADGVPVAKATIWACSASPAPDSLGVFRRCGRTATSGPDGAYAVGFLSPERSPYSIIAFLDADGDGAYSPAEEAGVMEANAAVFTAAGDTTRGIDLTLEPPASNETSGSGEPLLEEEGEQE